MLTNWIMSMKNGMCFFFSIWNKNIENEIIKIIENSVRNSIFRNSTPVVLAGVRPTASRPPFSAPAVWWCTRPFVVGTRLQHGPDRPRYFPIGVFHRRPRRVQLAAKRSRWSTEDQTRNKPFKIHFCCFENFVLW